MLIRIGYDIMFEHPAPTPLVMMLYTHPSRAASLRKPEQLVLEPPVPVQEFTDGFGNHCGCVLAPTGRLRFLNDTIVEDGGEPDPQGPEAKQHEVHELPHEVLQYLLPSRYCEVDRLGESAWKLFGTTPKGWPRVQAICDFVHAHIHFDYMQARATRTAFEIYEERVGVCRDFMHLAVTFCRCLNIPARYATGYLGDIGVPPVPDPMDFSAWFEVFLGARWWAFDARHNMPRIGRVLMACGRDAADVAFITSFGPHKLVQFTVWTDEVNERALLQGQSERSGGT